MRIMKVECGQCGAEHVVIESDFFLRCAYCDATILVRPPRNTPHLVSPAVDEDFVERLFPAGTVISFQLKYFPFHEPAPGDRPVPCFKQPWPDLDGYVPPSGDRKVFDDDLVEPESMIPFHRSGEGENVSSGRIVFHPFFQVMLKLEGYSQGVLVDGVSGVIVGDSPFCGGEDGDSPEMERLFLRVLLPGLGVSLLLYLATASVASGVRLWIYALAAAAGLWFCHRRFGRK